ncbi:ataxin-1-like protein [Dinothrombium tinctorium]|uniref:Ataxin-1-like protein n=1 Tax=Dinothrombium tinctorium TaxID=1965070 RepID=A0A3S3RRN2_9ACAR|nr:ataxin-1-like protein [Dinothrombium tinctorium]RWS05617.1 ataxin-1-like protein [Dinothrombium tinctorium]
MAYEWDTNCSPKEIGSGHHGHGSYAGHPPMPPFQFPPLPNYLTLSLYQSQYCPSGYPSSPFPVPTPPASAPPTGPRTNFFGADAYHQALINATASFGSSNSNAMLVPQNLSLRSPTRHSPISPSSINSPISGRNATVTHQLNQVENAAKGREGTLKHRILRPPNIQLNSKADVKIDAAPMSAPPCPVDVSDKVFKRSHSSSDGSNTSESTLTSQLQYPECFRKGSYISLTDGTVKHIEDMSTQDFINCAELTPHLKIDSSVVVEIEEKIKDYSVLITFCVGKRKQKFTVEAPVEHPFYVYHQGWASCSPEKTLLRYGLICKELKIDDVCISLTNNSSYSQKATSLLAKTSSDTQSAIVSDNSNGMENKRGSKLIASSSSKNIESVSLMYKKRRHSAPDMSECDSPPILVDSSKTDQSS